MTDAILLDEVLALALKLPTRQRLQLIEQIASSVEREIETPSSGEEHWGKNLLRLLDELKPIELSHPEIEDSVEWVKQIRQEQEAHRRLDWGQNE